MARSLGSLHHGKTGTAAASLTIEVSGRPARIFGGEAYNLQWHVYCNGLERERKRETEIKGKTNVTDSDSASVVDSHCTLFLVACQFCIS